MPYRVILKNIHNENERITLRDGCVSQDYAEQERKLFRKVLGGKNWTINRRPGLDTLDFLGLAIEKYDAPTGRRAYERSCGSDGIVR